MKALENLKEPRPRGCMYREFGLVVQEPIGFPPSFWSNLWFFGFCLLGYLWPEPRILRKPFFSLHTISEVHWLLKTFWRDVVDCFNCTYLVWINTVCHSEIAHVGGEVVIWTFDLFWIKIKTMQNCNRGSNIRMSSLFGYITIRNQQLHFRRSEIDDLPNIHCRKEQFSLTNGSSE